MANTLQGKKTAILATDGAERVGAVTVARASIQPPRLGMKGESYADCKFETA